MVPNGTTRQLGRVAPGLARPAPCRRGMAAARPLPPMGIQPSALSDHGREHRVVGSAADEGAHPRLLHRLGPGPRRAEVDELAVVLGLVGRPDGLHGRQVLAHDVVAPGPVDAVVLGLGAVPAEPDPERDPPAAEVVERGHLLGQQDRLVLRGEEDAGAEPDACRDGGGRGERDQRVEAALVVVESHPADERGRRVLGHGEVRVLGQVERVEAEFLDRGRPGRPAPGRRRSGRR